MCDGGGASNLITIFSPLERDGNKQCFVKWGWGKWLNHHFTAWNHHKASGIFFFSLMKWIFISRQLNTIERFKENYSDRLPEMIRWQFGAGEGGKRVKAEKSALNVSKSKDHPTYKLWTAGKIQVHSISKIFKVLSYNVSWRYMRSVHLCAEMLQSGGRRRRRMYNMLVKQTLMNEGFCLSVIRSDLFIFVFPRRDKQAN